MGPTPPVRATATSPHSIGGKGGAHFVADSRRPSKKSSPKRRPIFYNRHGGSSPNAAKAAAAKKKSSKKYVTITDSPPSVVAAASSTVPHTPSSPPAASTAGLQGDVDPSLSDITHSHVDLEDPDADLVYPLVPLPTVPVPMLSSSSLTSQQQQQQQQPSYAPKPATPPPPILRVPVYGWKFHQICDHEIWMYGLRKCVVETQIIAWTMWTIIAAVLYAHSYQGYPQVWGYPADGNTDVAAYVLFASTILFPPYIAILVKWRQQLVSTDASGITQLLRVTRARLEAEIYLFRVGVGPYKDDNKDSTTDNDAPSSSSGEAAVAAAAHTKKKQAFLTRAKALWTTLTTSLVTTASKRLWDRFDFTFTFWLDDENDEPEEEQAVVVTNTEVEDEKETEGYVEVNDEFDYSELPRQPLFCASPRDLEMAMPTTATSSPPTETTPLSGGNDKNDDKTVDTNEAEEQKKTPTKHVVDSDPRRLLTVDEYVAIRLDKIIDEKAFRITLWKYSEMGLTQIVVVLTFVTTAVALLSMQWTIPILLAVVAGITTTLEWARFTSRLQIEQTTLSTLQSLREQFRDLLSSSITAGSTTTNDCSNEGSENGIGDSTNGGDGGTRTTTSRLVEEVEAVVVKGVVAMTV